MDNTITEHTERQRACQELASHDGGYRAAFHILLSPRFDRDDRVWQHVHLVRPNNGIYFEEMLDTGRFSGGERLLLQVAWSLFNGGVEVTLDDLYFRLDRQALELVLEAMRLRVPRA